MSITDGILGALLMRRPRENEFVYTYGGRDLSLLYTAAELHDKVAAEDFSGIYVGDYWPITLNGTFNDYGSYLVPAGTTWYSDAGLTTVGGTYGSAQDGYYQSDAAVIVDSTHYVAMADCVYPYVRTCSNVVVKMEVAGINVYRNAGAPAIPAHLVMCPRDGLPFGLRMRTADQRWYSTAIMNPWRGSALYETMNGANGLLPLFAATALGPYIYAGPNGAGMEGYLDTWASTDASSPNSWSPIGRGKLFLPMESEVYGRVVLQTNYLCCGFNYEQWPIFAGSLRHVVKGNGNGGSRDTWWLASPSGASAFALVTHYGMANSFGAHGARCAAPCFLFS
jgi:hypothetical protein